MNPNVSLFVSDKQLRNAGFQLARGVAEFASVVFFVVILAGAVVNAMGLTPTDDTDAGPWGRSGLQPITDHRTGCEYLRTSAGAVTPRLDQTGKPICGAAQHQQ